ncbi:MAG: glycosyltransferase family 39 protein [Polyangiaceae bacterium]
MGFSLSRTRVVYAALGCSLLLWTFVMVHLAFPLHLGPHWRQAETQSIALNFLLEPNVFFPRINWGGSGPGYVESEFQLYAGIVALGMAIFGRSESVGQWVSLLAMAGAAAILFKAVRRYYGDFAGLMSVLVMLGSRNAVHLGSAVMPDALCALFYAASLERFLAFIEGERRGALLWSAMFLALAGLVKPIALGGGLAQALIIFAYRREWLKSKQVWFAWGAVLLVIVAYLFHAAELHHHFGNTFGVVSGGDSKFPDLAHLRRLHWLAQAFYVSLEFGVGYLGVVSLLVLLLVRRLRWIDVAIAFGGAAAILVSLRYSCDRWLGCHYHVFLVIAEAWLVAAVVRWGSELPWARAKAGPVLAAAFVLVLIALFSRNLVLHRGELAYAERDPVIALGAALRKQVSPGQLVVVQSSEVDFDVEWRRPDNYQDPRLFYLSNTRGWVLPANVSSSETLELARTRGARFYATAISPPPVVSQWLAAHAEVVWQDGKSQIWRLSGSDS